MKKKVDSRVRDVVHEGVLRHHRSLVVVVGDRGRDQVVNLYYLLSKLTHRKPSLLWCFEKELGFTSHRKKRLRQLRKKASSGNFDPNIDDPFELFVSTTDIRYCYYKETTGILGQTFGMCVLQDFECLTPNVLCRAIETVEGGGLILLLLKSFSSLEQLYCVTMGYHRALDRSKAASPAGAPPSERRFVKRFILSLTKCSGSLIVDDELTILPIAADGGREAAARAAGAAAGSGRASLSTEAGTSPESPDDFANGGEESAAPSAARRVAPSGGRRRFALTTTRQSRDLRQLQEEARADPVLGPLVAAAATADQARAVQEFVAAVREKSLNSSMALFAGRGRGKSAALGLVLAAAVAYGYSNIFVAAPSPENVRTVFEFAEIGLLALGFREHSEFELVAGELHDREGAADYERAELGLEASAPRAAPRGGMDYRTAEEGTPDEDGTADGAPSARTPSGAASSQPDAGRADAGRASRRSYIVRLNVFKSHRQTIQYIAPDDIAFARQSEILVIDEAAAIPLPILEQLFGPYFVFLSSTVSGYEGTGRSLVVKVMQTLKAKKGARSVRELTLETPIRYAAGDPIEQWLKDLLCLDGTVAVPLTRGKRMPVPAQCALYLVNRSALFSFHEKSELFLRKLLALFVASHYKNSPNDLLLLTDAPSHFIFVLLAPPFSTDADDQVPDILAAVQVSLEGRINKQFVREALQRGQCPSGDLLAWTLSQVFVDEDFAALTGARIVRIAVHPTIQNSGFGSEAIRQLVAFLEATEPGPWDRDETSLLAACDDVRCIAPEPISYLGTAFGLTHRLLRFHHRLGFRAVHLRQSKNEITGEQSVILIRTLNAAAGHVGISLSAFVMDFQARFVRALPLKCFRHLPCASCMLLLASPEDQDEKQGYSFPPLDASNVFSWITPSDLVRLQRYSSQLMDRTAVSDLISSVAEAVFLRRLEESVTFSQLQKAVLLAVGLQRRTLSDIRGDLDLATIQINTILLTAMQKVTAALQVLLDGTES